MYEKFYGFHSKPFQLNPDPSFYFASVQHRRAKAYLDYGVTRNEGFVVITGDVGAGKTTIVRGLLENFHDDNVLAAHLVSTQLEADDLLRAVGAAFGVRVRDVPKSELLMALEVFLVSQAGLGRRCLLIVDEAQNLSLGALEELRMLSNFQFGTQALLQSFLVGQPEFREKINHPRLVQLRQRIIAACHLGPLDRSEIEHYVEHRLFCAGAAGAAKFDAEVYEKVFVISGGIPRNINLVFDRILLHGFLNEKNQFTGADVEDLQAELLGEADSVGCLPVSGLKPQRDDNTFQNQAGLTKAEAMLSQPDGDRLASAVHYLLEGNRRLDGQLSQVEQRLDAIENSNSRLLAAVEALDCQLDRALSAQKL